jgi:hypothetical protein
VKEITDVRGRILELAIQAIDSGGEVAVRVNDLAAAAGVTVPTLYRYFGSRDGLIVVAQTQRFRRTQNVDANVFAAALAKCTTREQLIRAFQKELPLHFERDRWKLRQIRLDSLGSGVSRPDLQASLAQAQREAASRVGDIVRVYQKKGWIRKSVDADALAYFYMGQILGRVLIEMGDSPVAEKKWNQISVDAVMAVVFGIAPK